MSDYGKGSGEPAPESHIAHGEQGIDPKHWLTMAKRLSREGEFEEVLELCMRILKYDRNNSEALNLKGEALENLGKFKEAIECYDKALSINQKVANLPMNQQMDDSDIEDHEVMGGMNGEIGEMMLKKGTDLLKQHEFEKGLGYIDEALSNNPKDELEYKLEALMALKESIHERRRSLVAPGLSTDASQSALGLESRKRHTMDERAWNSRGAVLLRNNDTEGAMECFEKALEISPDYDKAWLGKGIVQRKTGNPEEALKSFESALLLHPKFNYAIFAKGCTLLDLNRIDESIQCFDEVLKKEPEYADAWFEKGCALYTKGDYDGAEAAYENALKIHPRDADAWYQKGNALFKLKRFEEAKSAYQRAVILNPSDFQALFQRGNCEFELGNYESAIASYDQALSLKGPEENVLNNKAVALRRLGRLEEAANYCEKAIEMNQSNDKFWFNMGKIMQGLNRHTQADICFKKASELGQKGPEGLKSALF